MIKDFIRTHRKGLLIGLILLGVVLIAMSAIIIGMLLTKEYSVIGPWYNEGLRQQLRFVDEDSMVISTAAGVIEADYAFDEKSGNGMISINGKAIDFYRKGDSIFLIGENGEAEYSEGELTDNVLATIAIEATSETTIEATTATTTATTTEPVAETTTAATEPAASSTAAATATPSPTPSPTATPTSTPFLPTFSYDFDPFLPILGTPVVGTWARADYAGHYIVFMDDGTYSLYYDNALSTTCTYTYDQFTGEGIMHTELMGDHPFTVNGDIFLFEYDYGIYERQE